MQVGDSRLAYRPASIIPWALFWVATELKLCSHRRVGPHTINGMQIRRKAPAPSIHRCAIILGALCGQTPMWTFAEILAVWRQWARQLVHTGTAAVQLSQELSSGSVDGHCPSQLSVPEKVGSCQGMSN